MIPAFRSSLSSFSRFRLPCLVKRTPHAFKRYYSVARVALTSTLMCLPATATAYKSVEPRTFATEHSTHILKTLGANSTLLRINRKVSDQMTLILQSEMVQGMATGTLAREEWERKYMQPDVLYIHKLGLALAERAKLEKKEDQPYVMEMAEMFLGYGKHFERLKKYGLKPTDTLVSRECDDHIALLSQKTTTHEFYVSILTDMIPYVVFANYLLHSIDPSDNNPWIEYARKYGDLNNKYAREKLGKIIQVANRVLDDQDVNVERAEALFEEGFSFEEWSIRHSFTTGFQIT